MLPRQRALLSGASTALVRTRRSRQRTAVSTPLSGAGVANPTTTSQGEEEGVSTRQDAVNSLPEPLSSRRRSFIRFTTSTTPLAFKKLKVLTTTTATTTTQHAANSLPDPPSSRRSFFKRLKLPTTTATTMNNRSGATPQEVEEKDVNRIIQKEGIVQGGPLNTAPPGWEPYSASKARPTSATGEPIDGVTFPSRPSRATGQDSRGGGTISGTVPSPVDIEKNFARMGLNEPALFTTSIHIRSSASIQFTQSARLSGPQVTPAYLDSRLPGEGLPPFGKEAPIGAINSADAISRSRGVDSVDAVIDIPGGDARFLSDLEQEEHHNEEPSENKALLPQEHDHPAATTVDKKTSERLSLIKVSTETMVDIESSSEESLESPSEEEEGETSDEPVEPHIPMSFQIPPESLRVALSASPNSAGSYYNQTLYRGPEDQFLTVHYCDNKATAERVAPYFLHEEVLGFDIEWKPWADVKSIKDNASLIQLASEDRIALFHISLFKGTTADQLLPTTLRTIIESPDILKVGVAIKGDFSRLERYLGVKAKGVFELSRLHNLVEFSESDPSKAGSRKLFSLAKQVHQHLQLPLNKGAVRESDWSKRLTREQIAYAATDAYASLRIFDALEAKRKKLKPVPPRPDVCDYDSLPRPKAAPRAKPAPKAAEEPVPEEEAQAAAEKAEESEEAYETAAEDLVDSQQLEEEEEKSESESAAESEDLDEEPDADYVPNTEDTLIRKAQSSPAQTRRVSRVNVHSLLGPDVKYPVLPELSSSSNEGESGTEAPAGPADLKMSRVSKMTLKSDLGDQVTKEPILEKDYVTELAPRSKPHDASTTASAQQDQTSTPSPALEVIDSGTMSTPSSTTGTTKDAQKAKTSPAEQPPTTTTPTSNPPSLSTPDTTTTSKSPAYLAADHWARTYLYTTIPSPSPSSSSPHPHPRIRATITVLRAYHLWHHQQLSPAEIAQVLRDPPLAESTVCGYILQAVAAERLAYGRSEIREVLARVPVSVRMTRWRWLVERVGGVDGRDG